MERRAITVRGVVQGVGFRPFVYNLAARHRLPGFVRNQTGNVLIEVEGEPEALDRFSADLQTCAPPLSRIEAIAWLPRPVCHSSDFCIEQSSADAAHDVFISPDIAVCADCLAELFDPHDRRYRYPFLNCTNCGPRLTIIEGAPYDRALTTMAGFEMCPACRAEYEDPSNRRFHAQPTACPQCGPRLEAVNSNGRPLDASDPLAFFVDALKRGEIGALKGLGGYHLVCDARNQEAVAELRRRKQREEMPLAVMVRDAAGAGRLCNVSAQEQELLESPQRPIVLLRRLDGGVCAAVAPNNPNLGVMLPYTPLHYVLLETAGEIPLVMTSGNRSHEPIAYRDDEALERLGEIVDVFLRHNRPIHVRCDDSVTQIIDGFESPIRRSRGYAPLPIHLPRACPRPMLAVGGQFKGVFALGRQQHVFLSHHLGDLDYFEATRQFERDISLYEDLFQIRPELIVHDLHPDYASTNYALRRADREELPLLPVQHHHAHMASCMAENDLDEPVIGVTFDGTGFGLDEVTGEPTIWGGEFLVGDYCQFRRAAHLQNVAMPGGDKAVKEPWRMAAAHLVAAGCGVNVLGGRISANALQAIEIMLDRRLNTPLTSSAGRLFDAVAALVGVRDRVTYEGQAAMQLEWLATDVAADGQYPFEIKTAMRPGGSMIVDTRPLIRSVVSDVRSGVERSRIARRFHCTMAGIIVEVCQRIRKTDGLERVVLSGGVFMNALLTSETVQRLTTADFLVYRHRLTPPNDAGLALGQLAIAAAKKMSAALETKNSEPVLCEQS